ncbi:putative Hsr recombination casette [Helicobacter mustelae 12198]|uniref:Putative Hsr recombination casette n=1 Tax=Helicobacter mustelae (strain ATCC 43772 / CCUG 25715 / CIP 103759 / LMG 18044 / NCTC 12198 / R85-136P) TaxID=679897 RepID=D3UI03_HELM1|nr:hypothetical protein [Helicobacter mustelae]CBG40126.1 putative Hsr recombination casette [Helicobacter mustelae 12198]
MITTPPGWAGSNNLLFQNNGTSSTGGAAGVASDGSTGNAMQSKSPTMAV